MEWITPALIVSFAALIIAYFSFSRDKFKIVITLDLETGKEFLNGKLIAEPVIITVTNVGRRSVFITSVGLCFDEDENIDDLLLTNGYREGTTLEEGSKPIILKIRKENIPKLNGNWKEVYATASDSSKTYYTSKKIKRKP